MSKEKIKILSYDEVEAKEFIAIQELRNLNNSDGPAQPIYEEPDYRVGLAFSGGGIRSATFGLGVLEALKKVGMLKKIDYLSTVSGGGYIGAWLSANCKRADERRAEQIKQQQRQNSTPEPIEPRWLEADADWNESIKHLRRYSNYLSPDLSLLSADTWSMATTWLRNSLPMQLMIFFAVACLLLIPRLLFWGFIKYSDQDLWNYATLGLLAFAGIAVVINLIFLAKANENSKPDTRISSQRTIQRISVIPLMLVSLGYAGIMWQQVKLWEHADNSFGSILQRIGQDLLKLYADFNMGSPLATVAKLADHQSILAMSLLSIFTALIILSITSIYKSKRANGFCKFFIAVLSAVVALLVLILIFAAIMYSFGDKPVSTYHEATLCLAFIWAGPTVLAAFSLAITLLIAIQGRDTIENIREWWSRLGAWLAIYALGCLLVAVFTFYAPLWSALLYYEGPWKSLSAGWVASTLTGLIAGKSAITSGANSKENTSTTKELIAKITPFIFILGLLVSVSMCLHLAIAVSSPAIPPYQEFSVTKQDLLGDGGGANNQKLDVHIDAKSDVHIDVNALQTDSISASSAEPQKYLAHWRLLVNADIKVMLFVLAACGFCTLVLSLRLDINVFSLNNFYRNRLARCYLGATRTPEDRHPHKFTGFDDNDDLKLHELVDNQKISGPFHILNCALNLGGSSDLSLHTRHSAIFTLTPLHCGSSYKVKKQNGTIDGEIGYIETKYYGGTEQPTLGQAISVSGAAASPNMGYHTSTPVSFLMTLFNARLGWWFPNPYQSKCQQSSPIFSLWYLLIELFGLANEKTDFLAISDGGHFENLAAYELIKRRCKVVIISDGECDPKLQFEGLATLIRMCEVDKLVKKIDIDVRAIHPETESGWSKSRCAIGKIYYHDYDPQKDPDGWLIYIKAAMNGHEETAVMQYKATHPDFPHESTGDQFYAEDQFESYRSLGKDIAEKLFGKIIKANGDIIGVAQQPAATEYTYTISKALNKIFCALPANQSQFTQHTDRLMKIWSTLSKDSNLKSLDKELFSSWDGEKPNRATFYLCSEMIQLMENVYLDIDLENTWHHEDNRGWHTLFKQWANSQPIKETWRQTRNTYGERFHSFWDRELTEKNIVMQDLTAPSTLSGDHHDL
ncbi:MAG: patatin-like phospholipase family protein [Methylococcales bacterium]